MIKKLWHKFWYNYHKKNYLYCKEYDKKYGLYDCAQFVFMWESEEKMKKHMEYLKRS